MEFKYSLGMYYAGSLQRLCLEGGTGGEVVSLPFLIRGDALEIKPQFVLAERWQNVAARTLRAVVGCKRHLVVPGSKTLHRSSD